MFESLGEKFDSLLRKLQGQGRITERNIEDALRDVRLALLEADVNVGVVRDFVEAVKRDALGEDVLRSLTPEQHFIKLVHRELVRALGGAPATLDLGGAPPVVVMLVGLNGSGKTPWPPPRGSRLGCPSAGSSSRRSRATPAAARRSRCAP